MLKIKKITDKANLNKLLGNNRLYEEECIGIIENDEIVEYAVYQIVENIMIIHKVSYNNKDFSLLDGLFKTLWFYADLSKTRFLQTDDTNSWFAKAFGFVYENGKYVFDIYSAEAVGCNKCNGEDK